MRPKRRAPSTKTVLVGLGAATVVVLVVVAVTSDRDDSTDRAKSGKAEASGSGIYASLSSNGETDPDPGDPDSVEWISRSERVQEHEALPCTGLKQPTNFEVFSAGPSIAGLPLNTVNRRCGGSAPVDEAPANFVNYIYGDCEVRPGASGCAPPLQIQTWPACERNLAGYSFEGKPMPYKRLSSPGGAEVVEVQFMFGPRIEVYTKSATVVIFAEDPMLAEEAVAVLRSQEIGNPPATKAEQLEGEPQHGLAPPSDGATEGELQCQS